MPNKYSHAFVLSNYASHGIVNFDRCHPSKSSSSLPSHRPSVKPQSPDASSSAATHASASSPTSERLRLESSTSPSTKPERPPLHRRSSSVETQIYAPIAVPSPPPTRNRDDGDGWKPNSPLPTNFSSASVQSVAASSNCPLHTEPKQPLGLENKSTENPKSTRPFKAEHHVHQGLLPSQHKIQQTEQPSIQGLTPQRSRHAPKPNLRHSSAVAVGGSEFASSNLYIPPAYPTSQYRSSNGLGESLQQPYHPYGRIPLAARAFVPERPPSPPSTPSSGRSFSLQTQMSKLDLSSPLPPVPKLSSRLNLPEPSPSRNNGVASNSINQNTSSKLKPISRPKSPARTTFSVKTRASSFDIASSSAALSSAFSVPFKGFEDDKVDQKRSHRASGGTSPLFAEDDADLESLPSTIDFDALPWCNHNTGPAVFREGELNAQHISLRNPALTRASSFDSAAPPPITLDRRMPPVFAEDPLPAILARPALPTTPKTPKKARPSLASLLFFRSAPKAILYSQTVPGVPPIPISVSRTAVPSIPALFPDYKGQFPPPPTQRQGSMSSTSQQQQQQKKDERSSRPPRTAKNHVQQKRGSSLPPRPSSKRRSWFKTDQLEGAFGMVQPDERRGLV